MKLREMPEFQRDRIFNFSIKSPTGERLFSDKHFVQTFLLCHKPKYDAKDSPGYVYIYCIESHADEISDFINAEFKKMNTVKFVENGQLPWSKERHMSLDSLWKKSEEQAAMKKQEEDMLAAASGLETIREEGEHEEKLDLFAAT